MKILALDTATHTGWARIANGVTDSGAADFSVRTKATKTIEADHPGRRFALFRNWLNVQLVEGKFDLVVYEAIVGGARAGGSVSLIQKGFEAIVLENAFRRGLPVWSFAPATIKKWATGSGQLTHESKIAMVETARLAFKGQTLLPHRPTKAEPWIFDDNQCDALWLLDLTRTVLASLPEVSDWMQPGIVENLTIYANQVTATKWPSNAKKRSKTK